MQEIIAEIIKHATAIAMILLWCGTGILVGKLIRNYYYRRIK